MSSTYQRYEIETKKTPNIIYHPHRFSVKVKRWKLFKYILQELFQYKANLPVVLSRPCVYGVFSGPIGGFVPNENLCVGCLRCTTQYPEMVKISYNKEREKLGDSYFTPDQVDTIVYEAETGRVPIKGAGYRGKFGGTGWDGMWTDMSEIVRPTRDGIHGREFISTRVEIGEKFSHLAFDENKVLMGKAPSTIPIPIPILYDPPLTSVASIHSIISTAAKQVGTFAAFPIESLLEHSLKGSQLIPIVSSSNFEKLKFYEGNPALIEILGWSSQVYQYIKEKFPEALIILRVEFGSEEIQQAFRSGIRIFHLLADYHGKGMEDKFVLDLIRNTQEIFVKMACRDEITLIGSGGMIAADHLGKAILCGLDAIALDTALFVGLQGKFEGECKNRKKSKFQFPKQITNAWGIQRIKNLTASWRDQLLEVLGAMGLREVMRLRGEMGRAMFQNDLEKEAFQGIQDYESI